MEPPFWEPSNIVVKLKPEVRGEIPAPEVDENEYRFFVICYLSYDVLLVAGKVWVIYAVCTTSGLLSLDQWIWVGCVVAVSSARQLMQFHQVRRWVCYCVLSLAITYLDFNSPLATKLRLLCKFIISD